MTSSPFAAYIEAQIRISGKTQREIADRLGYRHANVISMFKTGQTKVPLAKVPQLAKALDLDPVALLRRAMNEYMPDLLRVMDTYVRPLTRNEDDWLTALHAVFPGEDLPSVDRNLEAELAKLAQSVS